MPKLVHGNARAIEQPPRPGPSAPEVAPVAVKAPERPQPGPSAPEADQVAVERSAKPQLGPSAPEAAQVAVERSAKPQPGPRARNPPPGGQAADRPSPLIGALALQAELARPGTTQAAVAKRHGMSRSALANKVRLLQLPYRAQLAIARGSIGEHHGRILLAAMRHGWQVYEAMANRLLDRETVTVAAAEELQQQLVAGECFRETIG